MALYFNRRAALQSGMTEQEIEQYLNQQKQAGNNVIDDSDKADELLQSQATSTEPQSSTPNKKSKSLLEQILPVLGGIGGGLAGAALGGPVGGIIGASAGAGLGQGVSELTDQEEGINAGRVLKETALGGVGEVTGLGIGRILGAGGKLLGKAGEAALDTTVSGGTKFSASGYQKALESGVDLKEVFKDVVGRAGGEIPAGGNPINAMVGKNFKGGLLNDYIDEAENVIQSTAGVGGNNVRISGADIIKAIKTEGKTISKELGTGARKDAIDAVIKDATEKYKNGFTIKQGLKTLRAANERFGDSIFAESGDAVVSAAQKLEADGIRSALKTRFPSIEGGLADQQKFILLREALKKSYSKAAVAGSNLSKVNLTRPGSVIDLMVNNPRVAGAAVKASQTGVGSAIPAAATSPLMGNILRSGAGQVAAQGLDSGGGDTSLQSVAPTGPASGISPTASMPTGGKSVTLNDGRTVTEKDIQQAMVNDFANGGKNIDKLKTLKEQLFGKGDGGLELSDTAIKTVNDLQGSITDLARLYSEIDEKSLTGPLRGLFANVPGNVEQQTLQAEIDRIKQVVGKALEGGVLRKEDEEKYKKILPTITDPKEVALKKIQQLYRKLNEDLSGYVNLQKGYGTATSGGTPVTTTTTDSSEY